MPNASNSSHWYTMLLVIQKEHMEPEMKPVFSLGDWRSEEWRHNPYGAADVNMTSQVCS